jgi:hypothetical protein
MEPRHDSALTDLFVNAQTDAPAPEVARELMATDFLYKHTLYDVLQEDFFRAFAARLRSTHALSWKATWEVTRAYAPTALKLMMLERCGVSIPPCLPLSPSRLPTQNEVGDDEQTL